MMKPLSLFGILGIAACSGAPGPSDDVGANSQPLECSSFDVYTAALASHTIDCLGTVGPTSYYVNGEGRLARAFDHCPNDASKLQSIDDILGVQYREQILPHARACMAGRWASWKRQFDASGVIACPQWRKDEVIAAPTAARIDGLVRDLPAFSERPLGTRGAESSAKQAPPSRGAEENYVFTAFFDGAAPAQTCATPAACAAQCAGGLPGFVLEAEGSRVLGDPTYWLLDTVFDPNPNPFVRPGYYHTMSYYGPLPGTIVAHRNRYGEMCSYYESYSGIHYQIPLQLNCVDITDATSCIALCLP